MSNSGGGPQIVIIGAGPSGLATGYFLKKRGYENVLILEKLGRVGGLCDSMTCGEYSFDLGANYVTPAYTEVLKMASEYGAKLYSERPFIAMEVPLDPKKPVKYSSMFDAVRYDDHTKKYIPVLTFLWLLIKFTWLRWRLSSVIDRPTFAGVEDYPELYNSMQSWLDVNGLQGLKRVLQLPSTMMGYGQLDETPALYVLKFMTVKTFVPMAIKEAPIIGNWTGWPKRFTKGFQRFWERVSWDLQVRTNVNVERVERKEGEPIVVHYSVQNLELADTDEETGSIECDFLVLACPQPVLLGTDAIEPTETPRYNRERSFIDLSPEEREMWEQVRAVWYCMTTYHVQNLNFGGKSPLAPVYPMAPALHPLGIAKQWDDCELVQFYSPFSPYDIRRDIERWEKKVEEGEEGAEQELADLKAVLHAMQHGANGEDPVKDIVLRNVHTVTRQMGGTIQPDNLAWHTYNRFLYFQHVPMESIKRGFYTQLEALQGQQNTFYVGGATNFELVEPVVEYAKHLVETHFPPVH